MVLASIGRFSFNSFQSIETTIPRDGPDLTENVSTAIHDGHGHDQGLRSSIHASTEPELTEGPSHFVWTVGVTLSFGDGFSAQYESQECTMS
jgi:hypothetical protein